MSLGCYYVQFTIVKNAKITKFTVSKNVAIDKMSRVTAKRVLGVILIKMLIFLFSECVSF